jgi:hypothetical protein
MNGKWMAPLVAAAMLVANSPQAMAQSEGGSEPSGGATASGGVTSTGAGAPQIAPNPELTPGGAAGANEARSLSTDILLGVGAAGLLAGIVLVTFNRGNSTILTTTGTIN